MLYPIVLPKDAMTRTTLTKAPRWLAAKAASWPSRGAPQPVKLP